MGDTISRQAAIDAMCELMHHWFGGDPKDEIREIKRELEKLSSAPQWIPCSERLPDKTDDYLCSYNGCAVVDICEYDPDRNEWGFFYDGGWKVVSNVIAWMPLPEPYKGGREE